MNNDTKPRDAWDDDDEGSSAPLSVSSAPTQKTVESKSGSGASSIAVDSSYISRYRRDVVSKSDGVESVSAKSGALDLKSGSASTNSADGSNADSGLSSNFMVQKHQKKIDKKKK